MTPSARSLAGLVLLVLAVSGLSRWWADRQDDTLGHAVAALAAAGDLRMLASETCGICVQARRWLTRHRVPFDECLIERDTACRQAFDALGAPGTPVFVVRGRPQLGFSPEQLRSALARPG